MNMTLEIDTTMFMLPKRPEPREILQQIHTQCQPISAQSARRHSITVQTY